MGVFMKLIVGLGNPGKDYEKTRHNIGFIVLDKLKDKLGVHDEKNKFRGLISETNINGEKILFLKPQTYMNLSGESITEVISFYKVNPSEDMLIIYDDMDMELGRLRIREKGSSGGHNGVKSIIKYFGQDFLRLKCGIGAVKSREGVINHVIGKFDVTEQEEVKLMTDRAVDCVYELIKSWDIERIMQKYNVK